MNDNVRWTYCYKNDRSNVYFEILNDVLSTYAENLHYCHDVWGNTELEKYVNGWMNWARQIEDYRDKAKAFKAMDAEKGTTTGRVDAMPQDWKLANRLVEQSPAYVGMVNGFVGLFQSMDMFIKALVKKGDAVEANVPKVGLDKTYEAMKAQNREDFLQILQVVSEYVVFECGQHEEISAHANSNLPVWADMLEAWAVIADDDTWP